MRDIAVTLAWFVGSALALSLLLGLLLELFNPNKFSKKKILEAIGVMTEEELREIELLHSQLSTGLDPKYFQILCVATLLILNVSISDLIELDESSFIGNIDSQAWVAYILHVEKLINEISGETLGTIEITPADVSKLFTFEDVVRYVENTVTPTNV
ncbi:MAG TPA: hypothetical protein VJ725_23965 [Thermoanaerobaculia bacterium]|nr:hypothetical protein [Thermoanaerobaculia bacterium]